MENNYKRNPLCTTRYINEEETLVVCYENTKIFHLNRSSSFIWTCYENSHNLDEIALEVAHIYNICFTEALSDVIEITKSFVKNGLLKPTSFLLSAKSIGLKHREINKELRLKIKSYGLQKEIPVRAILELTGICNLNCIHCYKAENQICSLSTCEIKTIITSLYELGCIELTVTGGEVFTRSDIFEILQFADTLGFSITILTNGTILSLEQIKKLSQIIGIGRVQISVYSDRADIHDSITRHMGSLELTLTTVKLLKRNGIKVRLACPVMHSNFHSYHGVVNLAKRFDCEYEFNYPITAKEDGDQSTFQYRLTSQELEALFAQNADVFCGKYCHENDSRICSAGRSLVYVSDTGLAFPCLLYGVAFGNLKDDSLTDLWKNSSILYKIRNLRIRDFERCSNCVNKDYCPICPGMNLLENGIETMPALITCQMAQVNKMVMEGGEKSV